MIDKQKLKKAIVDGKVISKDTLANYIQNQDLKKEVDDAITASEERMKAELAKVKEREIDLPKILVNFPKFIENVKGEKGDKGEPGNDGYTPVKNKDYFEGKNGKDGKNGVDGKDAPLPDVSEIVSEASRQVTEAIKPLIPIIKPLDGSEVRDILESLKEDERLDVSAIKGLDTYLKDNAAPIPNFGGGGSTARDLYQLGDVNITGIQNGQTLVWQSSSNSWVNSTSGSTSPLTTKGDLYTFSTVNARLPVGTNGQVLSADSTQATGLKWIALAGGGDMVQATYDPAGIGEQLVGLTATQSLSNKTITAGTFATSMTGSYLNASQILITDASKNIISAAVATYPSLTELSYVKGVTSAIQTQINAKGTGTVTTISVVSANGFAGTVANASTTPAITLTTSITGVLKGNGTAISAATAGSDYAVGSTGLSGGQTIAGGTLTTQNLTLRANAADLTSGSVIFTDTTEATSSTVGAATFAGGVAVAKRLYALNMTVTNAITGSVTGSSGTVTSISSHASTELSDTANIDYLNQTQTITAVKTFSNSNSATGANTIIGGKYIKFGLGSPNNTVSATSVASAVELWDSDNTNVGVQMGVGNSNSGHNAWTGFYLNNDLASDGLVDHYGFIGLNSSTMNNTSYGTGLATANQMYFENTDGPITFATQSGSMYANFLVGGFATGNEVGRFTTAGLTVGLIGTLTGAIKFAGATSTQIILQGQAVGSSGVLTLPAATDTLVGKATTDTLTNKTLTSSTNTLGGITMGLGSDAVGDIYAATTSNVLSRIAAVATGQPFISKGVTTLPGYAGYTFSATAAQTYTFPTSSQTLASLAGTETLTNKTLSYVKASSGGTTTGAVITLTSTETQAVGDVVQIDSSGKAHLAKADVIADASVVLLSAQAFSGSASGIYLLPGGTCKLASSPSWTVGGLVYLSTTGTTGNTLTQTAPSSTNNVIQIIGVALAADVLLFLPSLSMVEHT